MAFVTRSQSPDIRQNPDRVIFDFRFVQVCSYHFLRRRKIKEILNSTFQGILKRLICYIDLEEARPSEKDINIVSTTEIRSDLVEYYLHLDAI